MRETDKGSLVFTVVRAEPFSASINHGMIEHKLYSSIINIRVVNILSISVVHVREFLDKFFSTRLGTYSNTHTHTHTRIYKQVDPLASTYTHKHLYLHVHTCNCTRTYPHTKKLNSS